MLNLASQNRSNFIFPTRAKKKKFKIWTFSCYFLSPRISTAAELNSFISWSPFLRNLEPRVLLPSVFNKKIECKKETFACCKRCKQRCSSLQEAPAPLDLLQRCKANRDEATRTSLTVVDFFPSPESYLKFSPFLYLKEHFLPPVAPRGFRASAAEAVFQSDHLLKRCPTGAPDTNTKSIDARAQHFASELENKRRVHLRRRSEGERKKQNKKKKKVARGSWRRLQRLQPTQNQWY